jgi:ArsR family transcriptional regulator
VFKTLMHPGRLAILELLRGGEQCVCHLEAALGMRQAYVSQQLSVLREAQLVEDQREGLNIYYRVVKPEVYQLIDTVRSMLGLEPSSDMVLPPKAPCPCPKCAATSTQEVSSCREAE